VASSPPSHLQLQAAVTIDSDNINHNLFCFPLQTYSKEAAEYDQKHAKTHEQLMEELRARLGFIGVEWVGDVHGGLEKEEREVVGLCLWYWLWWVFIFPGLEMPWYMGVLFMVENGGLDDRGQSARRVLMGFTNLY
jgi:hypothetical protein